MATKFTIVIEGEDDQKFIKDVLSVHYPEQIKNLEIEYVYLRNNANELKNYTTPLLIRKEAGHEIIIILDGDLGSYNETRAIVDKYTQGIDPKIFLFPDNQSFGRLETLLRALIPDQNKALLNCIDNYRTCIDGLENTLLKDFDHHNEIFVYVDSLKEGGKSKGKERDYSNKQAWNLTKENVALHPLLNFLSKHTAR